ncbi:MAG: putative hydrolase, partial [Frankiales bacterium]|nr:putative hydrolase [Frankiales bacterium]
MPDLSVDRLATDGRALGTGSSRPSLTWTVTGSEAQSFQVQVASAESFTALLADTGERQVEGPWLAWPAAALRSRQRAHWRVRVRGAEGWSDWAASWVEAGLLTAEDWSAVPIG